MAAALWAVATLPILSRLAIGRTAGDVSVFMHGAQALLDGRVYRDVAFEYPPYALLWFLPPALVSSDLDGFRLAFGLQMWLTDGLIKALLLWHALRARTGLRDLVPFLVYSLGSGALGHVLLQRYDLIPAVLTLGATLAVAGGWALLGGVLVVIGAGTKLYPAVLIPTLAIYAWHRGRSGLIRFIAGSAIATLPLVIAAAWLPWWRFASYHVERGLQVESLLASIVWALHFAGVPAGWELIWRTHEVTGSVAARLVVPGQLLWLTATLAAVASSILAAWRLRSQTSQPVAVEAMSAVLLLPLAAFVATNIVLSPQFHLWLLPLAALVLSARSQAPGTATDAVAPLPVQALRGAACIIAATLIVPAFYPHREFAEGLGGLRTALLVLRNLLLVYATACLWIGVTKVGRRTASAPARG